MRYASILPVCLLLAAPAFGAAAKASSFPAFPSDLQQAVDSLSAPAAGEETWTQRKNAQGEIVHIRCTATQCDMPQTCPQAGPPCLAQSQKEKEAPLQQKPPSAPTLSKDVAGTVVDDILKGQPENSLSAPEDAASESDGADWSGLESFKESMEEAPALKRGGAVEEALRMREEALKRKSDLEGSSSPLDPAYRNSPLFGRGAQNLTSNE